MVRISLTEVGFWTGRVPFASGRSEAPRKLRCDDDEGVLWPGGAEVLPNELLLSRNGLLFVAISPVACFCSADSSTNFFVCPMTSHRKVMGQY